MVNAQRSRIVAGAAIVVGSVLLTLVLFSIPPLDTLELRFYNFMMARVRGQLEPPSEILIVAIDEDSREEFESERGFTWPWPRSIYADLIRSLNAAGARAVAFDIIWDQESICFGEKRPKLDTELAEAIRASQVPVIVGAMRLSEQVGPYRGTKSYLPLQRLTEAGASVGFVNFFPDRDNVIRRAYLRVGRSPTLVSQTLTQIGHPEDEEDGETLINYIGPAGSIPTVSYSDALDPEQAERFRDKVVFVGRSLDIEDLSQGGSQADLYPSPFNLGRDFESSMPGVEIHAQTLNTILNDQHIGQPAAFFHLLGMLFLGGLISAIVQEFDAIRLKIGLSALLMGIFVVLSLVAFVYWSYWIPTVGPIAMSATVLGVTTLYQYTLSERERAHIRRALKGYVSPQVMQEVLRTPGDLELGGTQIEATVLFSDIAGFSKVAEDISARELASRLNVYFTDMGDVIMKRSGMINKYVGDSIMAVWGAPLANPDHAALACQAALAMGEIAEGGQLWNTRIGINTGSMLAGNLGHKERMEYTVIGDAVNLASRLEGANKAFGTLTLISESTELEVRGEFQCRPVDWIRVVGKDRPVRVFELMAPFEDRATRDLIASFESVIEHYEARDWEAARRSAEEHLQKYLDDSVARTYLRRCEGFIRNPPAEDWDGVYLLERK